jgi:hypothetical protein
VTQYDSFTLNYAAYNPKETPTKVEIIEQGSIVSSASVSFASTEITLRAMNSGTENCIIRCANTSYNFKLVINKSDLELSEPTDGLVLKLSAQGRTNNDTNKTSWEYEKISTDFSGFNYGGDGWQGDFLRHKGDARSVVKYKPLEQPTQNADNAFVFMIKYKATDVINEDAEIIKCLDKNGTGFVITPTEARMVTNGNSEVSLKMASDNVYEVGFVSMPIASNNSSSYEKENTEMLYLYINGIMSGAVQRGTSDGIYQENPQYIEIGVSDATTDVYLMRAYNTFLTDDQMLACYILDQDTADELLSKYNDNDILDDNGNISIDTVPEGMRVIIITGKQTNGTATVLQAAITNNKKTKFDIDEAFSFVKGGRSEQNFRNVGGCISLQGTSSLAYPIKN